MQCLSLSLSLLSSPLLSSPLLSCVCGGACLKTFSYKLIQFIDDDDPFVQVKPKICTCSEGTYHHSINNKHQINDCAEFW
jgi:hypothetical protein